MPNKCCVPLCKRNNANVNKVNVFSFPKDKSLRQKWITVIPRADFTPTKNARVCGLHFLEENIIRTITYHNSSTGQIVTVKLKHPRLKPDAIPTQFFNYPNYSSTPTSHDSKDTKLMLFKQENFVKVEVQDENLVKVEDENFFKVQVENIKVEIDNENVKVEDDNFVKEFLPHQKSISYQNYDELFSILHSLEIPEGWFKIYDKEEVTVFKLIYTPELILTYSVVINNNLQVTTFLYGKEMAMSFNNLQTPFISNNLDEIKDLLQAMDVLLPENVHSDNEKLPFKSCYKH